MPSLVQFTDILGRKDGGQDEDKDKDKGDGKKKKKEKAKTMNQNIQKISQLQVELFWFISTLSYKQ